MGSPGIKIGDTVHIRDGSVRKRLKLGKWCETLVVSSIHPEHGMATVVGRDKKDLKFEAIVTIEALVQSATLEVHVVEETARNGLLPQGSGGVSPDQPELPVRVRKEIVRYSPHTRKNRKIAKRKKILDGRLPEVPRLDRGESKAGPSEGLAL
jgi:hypothetical protein